ncbi:hypothetical protein PAEPH01_2234 [Pancytospora epiphaga]|nr:hypothetical protein PAEPH01_2234 [Pancytospora epiphaga]
MKRGHSEQIVDLVFLLGQRRMLTMSEYAGKLLAQPYTRYQELYYKRRLSDIFEFYGNQVWFRERYLENERRQNKEAVSNGNKYIVIEDIDEGITREELYRTYGSVDGVVSVSIAQKGTFGRFMRDLYVEVSEECNLDGYLKEVPKRYNAFILDISMMKINEICRIALVEAKKLYGVLCNLYGDGQVPESVLGETSTLSVLAAMRNEFLYCSICSKKYDNVPSMHRQCSRHSESDFSCRNIELATTPKDFSKICDLQESDDMCRYIIADHEEAFRCGVCQKRFQGTEFVYNHIKLKHSDLVDALAKKREDHRRFVLNIDFFILELMEGTSDKRMPLWGKSSINYRQTVYDYPLIFTGEISINRN